jgi:hypothetical protein
MGYDVAAQEGVPGDYLAGGGAGGAGDQGWGPGDIGAAYAARAEARRARPATGVGYVYDQPVAGWNTAPGGAGYSGGGPNLEALGGIANWQRGSMADVGVGALRQFRGQTLANFRNRYDFSNLMRDAGAEGAKAIQGWAQMAIDAQDKGSQRELEQLRYAMQDARAAREEARQQEALDLNKTRYGMEWQRQDRQDLLKEQAGAEEDAWKREQLGETKRHNVATEGRWGNVRGSTGALNLSLAGASQDAIDAYTAGDYQPLQDEIDAGTVDPRMLTGRSGRGAGARTKAAADDEADYQDMQLQRAGYYTPVIIDSKQTPPPWSTWSPEDLGAFRGALPRALEQYPNEEDAMHVAASMVKPESVFPAALSRFGFAVNDYYDAQGKPLGRFQAQFEGAMQELPEDIAPRYRATIALGQVLPEKMMTPQLKAALRAALQGTGGRQDWGSQGSQDRWQDREGTFPGKPGGEGSTGQPARPVFSREANAAYQGPLPEAWTPRVPNYREEWLMRNGLIGSGGFS